ncbi:hypothetical protein R20233_00462 [Ralstonia sp. LMG 32965]|nr:hypothetical protein R20233_00462 [Ralstonia sp. LMG 32965]
MHGTNDVFAALHNEAKVTNDFLVSGGGQLADASYARRENFFFAFSALSVGLERLGKLCLLLDRFIEHQGCFPSTSLLKQTASRDLKALYELSQRIIVARHLRLPHQTKLDHPAHVGILDVLTAFAKGSKYAEIDLLAGVTAHDDPMLEWAMKVDANLYRDCLSEQQKAAIASSPADLSSMLGSMLQGLSIATENNGHGEFYVACQRSSLHVLLSPYRMLYAAQVARYWVELLIELEPIARDVRDGCIPPFQSSFAFFTNDDGRFLGAASWQ